jgi:hypothetical protein
MEQHTGAQVIEIIGGTKAAVRPGMRILLRVPVGWYQETLRSGLTHYRDPERPDLRMLVSALVPMPDNRAAWRSRELLALVPDDCELVVHGERRAYTDLGWPLRVVDAECRRGGDTVEAWLGIFLEHGSAGGVALVRAPRAVLDTNCRRQLLDILATARADASALVSDVWGALAMKARA